VKSYRVIVTSVDMTYDYDESRDAFEFFALLPKSTEVAVYVSVPSETQHIIPLRLKRRIIYSYALLPLP